MCVKPTYNYNTINIQYRLGLVSFKRGHIDDIEKILMSSKSLISLKNVSNKEYPST